MPPFLRRLLPIFSTPEWLEAEKWRRTVRNQPIAIICREALTAHIQAMPWEVRARKPAEAEELADDIEEYTKVLQGTDRDGDPFDATWEKTWQDGLDLPIGGNVEIVRWPAGAGPFSRPHPKGHAYKVVHVDGATLYPTHDRDVPMAQRVKGRDTPIYFARNEMARILLTPRPELTRKGYGMPPPERGFLALSLLFRGDTYYANLLLDTPEAGLLDLIDMSKESADEWLDGFRDLLGGIDPMKIAVLYEHDTPANYLPFGRPPTELMFDQVTLKYGRIMAASYWLSLSDVGLESGQAKTLAGQIRDEQRARRSGFGIVREKTTNLINSEVLPDYLEFAFIERDAEAMTQRYRAFLMAAQAMKAAKEANVMTARERQAQLKKDGLITVEVEEPEEQVAPRWPGFDDGGLANDELDRVPPAEGGRGDLTARAVNEEEPVVLGDERIAGVPADSPFFDQMAVALQQAFGEVLARMGDAQVLRLVKAATRVLFPTVEQAATALTNGELFWWSGERAKMWLEEKSAFDELPEVKRASQAVLDELEDLLMRDRWWEVAGATEEAMGLAMRLAFSEGAFTAASLVQELLYTEGLADSPDMIGLNFDLQNPRTLAQLEAKAAQLVTRVNEGTKYYLKRILTSGVEQGLASPTIAQLIREGAGVEEILLEAGYTEAVIRRVREEVEAMSEARTISITNTEINRAETDGNVIQWEKMGLTRKGWVHTGPDIPCPVCVANQDLGLVDIDFLYASVFGEADTLGPPAHPKVCHCHIELDIEELVAKAGELTPWMGD